MREDEESFIRHLECYYDQDDIEEEQIYAQIYDLMRKLNYPETDFNSFCGHINQMKLERLLEIRALKVVKNKV